MLIDFRGRVGSGNEAYSPLVAIFLVKLQRNDKLKKNMPEIKKIEMEGLKLLEQAVQQCYGSAAIVEKQNKLIRKCRTLRGSKFK